LGEIDVALFTLTCGVTLAKELDLDVSNDQATVLDRYFRMILSMSRVVLELVGSIFHREKGIVNGNDSGVRVVKRSAHYKTADAAESVDSYGSGHGDD
jgi:hypothetical protein